MSHGQHETADELARNLGSELYVFEDSAGDGSRLEEEHGSFDWVRQGNESHHRSLRLQAASFTLAASRNGGYYFNGDFIRLNKTKDAVNGTQLVRASDVTNVVAVGGQTAWKRHKQATSGKIASERSKAGRRVAVVSAASAYHAGGGFQTGGRHALEEALCVQSTLYLSLEKARQLATLQGVRHPGSANPSRQRNGQAWECHIPENGVVLSPHVEFFRGETSDGYAFKSHAFECTVISVAMPNCASNIQDAPVDIPNAHEYEALLGQKCLAVLGAAARQGADCLVMPDAGCGVYMNHPEQVGRAFGEAVRRHFPEAFAEIHLVGGAEFQAAAEAAGRPGMELNRQNVNEDHGIRGHSRRDSHGGHGSHLEEANPTRALDILKRTVDEEMERVQAKVDQKAADVLPTVRALAAESEQIRIQKEDVENERRTVRRRKAEVEEQLLELQQTRAQLERQAEREGVGNFFACCMVPTGVQDDAVREATVAEPYASHQSFGSHGSRGGGGGAFGAALG